jgi:molybdopterin synthase catalytic subunit
MTVQVLFFGMLKDLLGRASDTLDVADGATMGTVFEHYASQYPGLNEMADSIALARNHEFAGPDQALSDGDEIALMPPVSGGISPAASSWIAEASDDGSFCALTREPIDSLGLVRRIVQGSDGAVITFEGIVRNNSKGRSTQYLDYECYVPLALNTMRQLAREIRAGYDIHGIALVHRLGRLEIGEASVSIVVASAHRQAAYEASLAAINRLKKIVPVWKKEYFEDGEVWVEGDWEDSVPRPAGALR